MHFANTSIKGTNYTHGTTNTAAALQSVGETFSTARATRPDVKDVLIIITDGASDDKQVLYCKFSKIHYKSYKPDILSRLVYLN